MTPDELVPQNQPESSPEPSPAAQDVSRMEEGAGAENPGEEINQPANEPTPQAPQETSAAPDLEAEMTEAQAERSRMVTEREALRRQHYQEILESGPRDVEELIRVVGAASFQDLRQHEIAQKYGEGRLGQIRAYLAGEFDVGIGRDDAIRRSNWNKCAEVGRRVLTSVFNRRTLAATGAAVILGVLTGGVGAAAGGIIFGSMAGRGVAEALAVVYGKETKARREILEAEKECWYELRRLSQELIQTQDLERRAEIVRQITALYFRQGEAVVLQKIQLAEEGLREIQVNLDKLRRRCQIAGEITGLGAGVAYSFLSGNFAAIDIDLWNKIKGQNIAHKVVRIDGVWHFVYNTAEKTTGVSGGALTHVLGEPAWKIAAATIVERGVPVLASAGLGALLGKKVEARSAEKTKKEAELRKKKIELQQRQIEETIPPAFDIARLQQRARELNQPMPQVGDIWRREVPNPDKPQGEKLVVYYRIEKIDMQSGRATVGLLKRDKKILQKLKPCL